MRSMSLSQASLHAMHSGVCPYSGPSMVKLRYPSSWSMCTTAMPRSTGGTPHVTSGKVTFGAAAGPVPVAHAVVTSMDMT